MSNPNFYPNRDMLWSGFPTNWSLLKRLMWVRIMRGGSVSPAYETVTGNPVTFETVRPAPLRQLSIAFSPIQSLNGYDAPWPAGGGKNKFNPSAVTWKKWRLDSNSFKTLADSDPVISVTVNGNESISITNTASYYGVGVVVDAVDYDRTASLKESINGAIQFWSAYEDGATRISTGATSCLIPANTSGFLAIRKDSTEAKTVFVQVELGSSATSYAPYSNICPISGWSSLTVEQTGKNLYPHELFPEYAYSWYSHPNFADAVHPIFLKAGTTYVVSGERDPQYSNWFFLVRMFDTQGNNVEDVTKISGGISTFTYGYQVGGKYFQPSGSGATPLYQTITPAIDCYVDLCVQSGRGEATNAMVEIGSTPSATYTPYNPLSRSISISLGETVYSGYVDVVTGVLTVTHKGIDLGSFNWTYRGANTLGMFSTPLSEYEKPSSGSVTPDAYCSAYKVASLSVMLTGTSDLCVSLGRPNSWDGYLLVKDKAYTDAADFKTAVTGVQLVYELATPIPIQLTPQEVQSLAGDNVVWSTANGDLTVEYRSN